MPRRTASSPDGFRSLVETFVLPATLGDVRYVVDENLLRMGKAIMALRGDVASFGVPPVADLLPPGMDDVDWIPIVAEHTWVVITNDRRLRTNPFEADMALRHGLKVAHLHGRVGHKSAWAQAERLVTRWPAVERQAPLPGPWWLSLRRTSTPLMNYQPGVAER